MSWDWGVVGTWVGVGIAFITLIIAIVALVKKSNSVTVSASGGSTAAGRDHITNQDPHSGNDVGNDRG